MKFTFDWLLDHIKTDLNFIEISEKMTALGIEVEEIIDNNKKYENFVVGQIIRAEKHPNADKLQVCSVNIGTEILPIVCGAKNARDGIFVAVARVGAFIPGFNENLKKGKIRDIESFGMMCSTDELLLEDDGIDGIMELPMGSQIGDSLAKALECDDVIFDVSLTPNRADCFSVRGIARDLAALGCGEFINLQFFKIDENIENPINSIKISTDKCKYFSTIALLDVCQTKTPEKIAKRLRAIGQKLINLPVDISNYICTDIGQPLHIFDLDKISNDLTIAESEGGERIETLDGREVTLPKGAIIVESSTSKIPFSIAGIMGGQNSAVTNDSKNILIEGAYFDRISIAKAGQILRITTDARTRFERGVDPKCTELAVQYAASLISNNAIGCKISNLKIAGELPSNKKVIKLTKEKFINITNLDEKEFDDSVKIFENLGLIIVNHTADFIEVETPSWRYDLEIEEDLIEEVLRIFGYENIKESPLEKKILTICQADTADKFSQGLIYNGYFEVKTFSFIDLKIAKLFEKNPEKLIKITDPLTVDFALMRPSLIASHLKSIKSCQNKSQKNSKIFEVGKRFSIDNFKIIEENTLTATLSQKFFERNWEGKSRDVSIIDAKAMVEKLLSLSISGVRLNSDAPQYYHPGRSGSYIFQRDTVVAHFGEIHPLILRELEIQGPIVCFEIFLDKLPRHFITQVPSHINLCAYQPTSRDFSFVVDRDIKSGCIIDAVKKLKILEIKKVVIFDVYESSAIGDNKKAVAFEVTLQSDNETLNDAKLSEISNKIIEMIKKDFNGILQCKV